MAYEKGSRFLTKKPWARADGDDGGRQRRGAEGKAEWWEEMRLGRRPRPAEGPTGMAAAGGQGREPSRILPGRRPQEKERPGAEQPGGRLVKDPFLGSGPEDAQIYAALPLAAEEEEARRGAEFARSSWKAGAEGRYRGGGERGRQIGDGSWTGAGVSGVQAGQRLGRWPGRQQESETGVGVPLNPSATNPSGLYGRGYAGSVDIAGTSGPGLMPLPWERGADAAAQMSRGSTGEARAATPARYQPFGAISQVRTEQPGSIQSRPTPAGPNRASRAMLPQRDENGVVGEGGGLPSLSSWQEVRRLESELQGLDARLGPLNRQAELLIDPGTGRFRDVRSSYLFEQMQPALNELSARYQEVYGRYQAALNTARQQGHAGQAALAAQQVGKAGAGTAMPGGKSGPSPAQVPRQDQRETPPQGLASIYSSPEQTLGELAEGNLRTPGRVSESASVSAGAPMSEDEVFSWWYRARAAGDLGSANLVRKSYLQQFPNGQYARYLRGGEFRTTTTRTARSEGAGAAVPVGVIKQMRAAGMSEGQILRAVQDMVAGQMNLTPAQVAAFTEKYGWHPFANMVEPGTDARTSVASIIRQGETNGGLSEFYIGPEIIRLLDGERLMMRPQEEMRRAAAAGLRAIPESGKYFETAEEIDAGRKGWLAHLAAMDKESARRALYTEGQRRAISDEELAAAGLERSSVQNILAGAASAVAPAEAYAGRLLGWRWLEDRGLDASRAATAMGNMYGGDSFVAELGRGAGQMGAMLLTPGGAGGAGAMGAMSTAGQTYREMLDAGYDRDHAWKMAQLFLPLGMLDRFGVNRGSIGQVVGEEAVEKFVTAFARQYAKGGAKEAAQETVQNVLTDWAAQGIYDPQRQVLDLKRLVRGGGVSFILGGAGEGGGVAVSRGIQAAGRFGNRRSVATGEIDPVAAPHESQVGSQAATQQTAPEGGQSGQRRQQYAYSSTHFRLPDDLADEVRNFGMTIREEDLTEVGRDTNPHVTIKYGLHGNDAEAVRQVLADEPPITARIGKTSIFPAKEGTDYDVIKVDVDSPDLHRLNRKLANTLRNTNLHTIYKPHVTIAYVKPGTGQKYAGDASLEGREVTLDRVVFTDRNGNVTEVPLTAEGSPPKEIPRPALKKLFVMSKAELERKPGELTTLVGRTFTGGIKEIRAKARKWAYENLQKKPVTNRETGFLISIGRSQLEKGTSGIIDPRHYETLRVLRPLLERANLVLSHADRDNDPNILAVHRFIAPLKINNEIIPVLLTVKDRRRDGVGYYTHELAEIEVPARALEPDPDNRQAKVPRVAGTESNSQFVILQLISKPPCQRQAAMIVCRHGLERVK